MGDEGPALAAAKREALRRLDKLTEDARSAFFDAVRHGRLGSSVHPEQVREICTKGFQEASRAAATRFAQLKGRRALNHVDQFRDVLDQLRVKVVGIFDEFEGSGTMHIKPVQSRSRLEEQLVKISDDIRDDLQVGVFFLDGAADEADLLSVSPTPGSITRTSTFSYVNEDRLAELRMLPTSNWDFSRLTRLCEELNSCFDGKNYIAVAALLRTIKEHVPPALGFETFSLYSAQANGKSHKASIERLDRSMKDIADQWLHGRIRQRETLPTASQVDFRQELDDLLGEVVRLNKQAG